jgi:4-amino-4-deoxy-L-arabinose transferase-like glycosyltransferase
VHTVIRSPLAWVLAAVTLLHGVGLDWGLPASDTWDNDGVAPRDFLVALSQTFQRSGFDFAYLHLAPVHLVLLGLLTLPVTIPALLAGHSMVPDEVVHNIIQVPVMTPIAYIARVVSLGMSVGIVWAVALVARELWGKRVAVCVAAVGGLNAALVYYAHVTNLEVPYLFWASLALLALVRAIVRQEPRRLRWFAALGAIAIGSKDQAAGLFLLGAPAVVLFWVLDSPWARHNRRQVLREAAIALAMAIVVFLVADEVAINPTGFAARVRFLLGPASSDHGEYTSDWAGRVAVLEDLAVHLTLGYPVIFAPLAALGLAIAARVRTDVERDRRAAALAPLLVAVSFTICINETALRTEHRFVLPQLIAFGLYAGLGVERLLFVATSQAGRWSSRAVAGVAFAWAILQSAAVDAALIHDPRYAAEACMRARVAPGDTIETYGLNVYLPRFPAAARVERVGPDPVRGRNPLPGVVEVEDDLAGIDRRRPRWVVVSFAWVAKYLAEGSPWTVGGRLMPRSQRIAEGDPARPFFRELVGGERGYRVVCFAEWNSAVWPRVDIHASTGLPVWVLERR